MTMKTFVVKYWSQDNLSIPHVVKVETTEVEAVKYVPLPQKVVNFYATEGNNNNTKDLVASFYDVISVALLPVAKKHVKPFSEDEMNSLRGLIAGHHYDPKIDAWKHG